MNEVKHHLVIAGTGRAGTSFLVQYLAACGLETHIQLNPGVQLDEHANAGLEDLPLKGTTLPQVIKSPWLYEFIDELLDRDDLCVDAVIIPMRDIVEAASSRVVNELRARLGREELPGELTQWQTWGTTPGGIVYSLNPLDQARVLSMGFHQVIYACVKKGVPLLFLEFPRFIEDGKYLYDQLRPVLAPKVSLSSAMAAHAATADPDKVRIGAELRASESPGHAERFPSFDSLDRAALYRELTHARRARDAALAESGRLAATVAELRRELEASASERNAAVALRDAAIGERDAAIARCDAGIAERDATLVECARQASSAQRQIEDLKRQVHESATRLDEVFTSTSWKMTAPIRKFGALRHRKS